MEKHYEETRKGLGEKRSDSEKLCKKKEENRKKKGETHRKMKKKDGALQNKEKTRRRTEGRRNIF